MSIFKRNNKKGITDEGIKQGQFEIQKTLKGIRELSMDDLEKVCGGVKDVLADGEAYWGEVYKLMLSGKTQLEAEATVYHLYGVATPPALTDDIKAKYPLLL